MTLLNWIHVCITLLHGNVFQLLLALAEVHLVPCSFWHLCIHYICRKDLKIFKCIGYILNSKLPENLICKCFCQSYKCKKKSVRDNFLILKLLKNRAWGNRKTLKRPKMMSKINFRTLKLKSHEEYLICRKYFVQ